MVQDANTNIVTASSHSGAEIASMPHAPAVMWNRINGRLTNNDIAMMIGDHNDQPIGIYLGEAPRYWDSVLKGRTIYLFAAEQDIPKPKDPFPGLSFNECVGHLWGSQHGAKLIDPQIKHDRDGGAHYTSAVIREILRLGAGEKTGHMIPPLVVVGGKTDYWSDEIVHPHNMYALCGKGAFNKAASAFIQELDNETLDNLGSPFYLSSDDVPVGRRSTSNICGINFANGAHFRNERYTGLWSCRPFIALRPPEL